MHGLPVLLLLALMVPGEARQRDSLLSRAESLLTAGNLVAARRIAEGLERARPDDHRVLTLLGRIHLAWPVFGRFKADTLLTRAGMLAPRDPEPFYYIGLTGLALGGDDGEAIARRGLLRVLALNPRYRDAWQLWLRLYRDGPERRAALQALEAHGGNDAVDLWRALLMVEQRTYRDAESLLRGLSSRRPDDPAPRALMARLYFEQNRDVEAAALYEEAVSLAPGDTGGVLWSQVRSIASPMERDAYDATAPGGREAFLRLFWARREPSLATTANERMGEHFRRLAHAQNVFRILHPLAMWHRSRAYRTMAGGLSFPADINLEEIRRGIAETRQARVEDESVERLPGRLGLGSGQSANLEDGLDDRGRIFVRYGRPDQRLVWSGDAETWRYALPSGLMQVTFVRRTAGMGLGGEQVVTPVVSGELASARYLLATDRPALPGKALRFSFWPAAFQGLEGETELVLFPTSDAAVAVLIDESGREIARDSATGRALHLVAPPGRYILALDGTAADRTGRYRGLMPLTPFSGESLAVSSLLVAGGEVPAVRRALEAAAPPGLVLRSDQPMRFYAEVYGLAGESGTARYEATYRFERLGRSWLGLGGERRRVSTIAFTREQLAGSRVIESLVIDPGRLPRGHYRVHLLIADSVRGARAASASLEFDLR